MLECDFLCVGGGLGGLAGAIAAHDAGLETIVVEKSGQLGGVTAYSGGVIWAPGNHLQEAAGFPDKAEAAAAYLDWLTPQDADIDAELRSHYLESAGPVFRYFAEQAGIPFAVAPRPDQYYPMADGSLAGGRTLEVSMSGSLLGDWQAKTRTSPIFKVGLTHAEVLSNGGPLVAYDKLSSLFAERVAADFRTFGPGLIAALVKAGQIDRAIRTYVDAPVTSLWMEDGSVAGVTAVIDGEETQIRARRGVLLATGAYGHAANAAELEDLPNLADASPPSVSGDGLGLLEMAGVTPVRAGDGIIMVGYAAPGETHIGSDEPLVRPLYRAFGCPHTMVVNATGRRFADESFYGKFFPNLRRRTDDGTLANYPCWLIVDDSFRQRYGLPPYDPGMDWPSEIAHSEDMGELARAVGIDPEVLSAEVAEFNRHAVHGDDPRFNRGEVEYARLAFGDPEYPNPNLGPLTQPPFWAVPLIFVGLGIFAMGARIDTSARVIGDNGAPVPGLYATGNAVAYTELPDAYTGGFANGRNIIYAYDAAVDAAKRGV